MTNEESSMHCNLIGPSKPLCSLNMINIENRKLDLELTQVNEYENKILQLFERSVVLQNVFEI